MTPEARVQLERDMAAQMQSVLGTGYVRDYYLDMSAGFVAIAWVAIEEVELRESTLRQQLENADRVHQSTIREWADSLAEIERLREVVSVGAARVLCRTHRDGPDDTNYGDLGCPICIRNEMDMYRRGLEAAVDVINNESDAAPIDIEFFLPADRIRIPGMTGPGKDGTRTQSECTCDGVQHRTSCPEWVMPY